MIAIKISQLKQSFLHDIRLVLAAHSHRNALVTLSVDLHLSRKWQTLRIEKAVALQVNDKILF